MLLDGQALMACLHNFAEQASWAELELREDLSDKKITKDTFVRIEKPSFWESLVKVRDVVATPNTNHSFQDLELIGQNEFQQALSSSRVHLVNHFTIHPFVNKRPPPLLDE